MSLLHDIQAEVLDSKSEIGPILLKPRFLASKLGSDVLEGWVKHETEGYPKEAEVPDYRMASLTFRGTFTDGYKVQNNVPIPEFIIAKEAGEHWLKYAIRDSIAVIDKLVQAEGPEHKGKLGVSAANMLPLLNNKVYQGMNAVTVSSSFSGAPFSHVHSTIRAKILDLTLELEKTVPVAVLIELGKTTEQGADTSAQTTTITQTVIYGNQTNILNNAPGGNIQNNVIAGDQTSLAKYLVDSGVPIEEAKELAQLAASEHPDSTDQPMGAKAKGWLGKVVGGAWDVSKEVGTQLLIEGLKSYYKLGA